MLPRYTTILLIALSILSICLSVFAAPTAYLDEDLDLRDLGDSFRYWRLFHGKWDDSNSGLEDKDVEADVDSYNGRKYNVMEKLRMAVCDVDTWANEILQNMGLPDEASINKPGPMNSTDPKDRPPTDFEFLLYKWRGYHDYLWFQIDPSTDYVMECEWFHEDKNEDMDEDK
ncbi:hypothetical protein BGX28_004961 [Mortierella sp. GBA30]|nr:hypothetical protein BGX28_004961 [Mortierella sp. GBA30]